MKHIFLTLIMSSLFVSVAFASEELGEVETDTLQMACNNERDNNKLSLESTRTREVSRERTAVSQ